MPNVFVIAPEPFNLGLLEGAARAEDVRFIELLSTEDAVEVPPHFSFDALIEQAEARLRANGQPDAIVNYWDFPGSCIAPLLCRRHALPSPGLEAVTTFEHKYWARHEMAAAVPEVTPRVCAIDPYADDPLARLDLPFPFWLKPVISHSSYLGFRIDDAEQFREALTIIRDRISQFGDPFDEFLKHVEVPAPIEGIGGKHCIAEEIISAEHQVTLEGYIQNGDLSVVGWIDSLREGQVSSSFSHYAYPSQVPESVRNRMKGYAEALLRHVGYDGAPFNIEFFWDEESDQISLLEVNTRISKSHCPLFLLVDGASHQRVTLDFALGRVPNFPREGGEWPFAMKFMVRLFQNGVVTRVPNSAELDLVRARYPEALVQVLVEAGQRLSHLSFQDSYSFEIADIFIGGRDDRETRRKYADILEMLPFEVNLMADTPSD